MTEDVVNHPSHYNQYTGFEVIDVCEQLRAPDGTGNYNRGNAFKYLARAGWKSPEKHVEDLKKAEFYIKREIQRIESNNWMDADPLLTKEEVREAAGVDLPLFLCLVEGCANPGHTHKKHFVSIPETSAFYCHRCGDKMTQKPDNLSAFYCERDHSELTEDFILGGIPVLLTLGPVLPSVAKTLADKSVVEDLADAAYYGEKLDGRDSITKDAPTTCGVQGCIEHPVSVSPEVVDLNVVR